MTLMPTPKRPVEVNSKRFCVSYCFLVSIAVDCSAGHLSQHGLLLHPWKAMRRLTAMTGTKESLSFLIVVRVHTCHIMVLSFQKELVVLPFHIMVPRCTHRIRFRNMNSTGESFFMRMLWSAALSLITLFRSRGSSSPSVQFNFRFEIFWATKVNLS